MNYTNNRGSIKQYNQVDVRGGVENADPHRLIQMLISGALEKITIAKAQLQRGDTNGKAAHISWAIDIISALQGCLDMEAGGEVASNLDALYEYMLQRLLEANAYNREEYLDEVFKLLGNIKDGWDAIRDEVVQIQQGDQQAVPPDAADDVSLKVST